MENNIRQGIVTGQSTPYFVTSNQSGININVDSSNLVLSFSFGSHNYLFAEVESVIDAWSGFVNGVNYWLYWDINLISGVRTFGKTTVDPTQYGFVLPSQPQTDQMFFDYSDKTLKVWTGTSWQPKLRVLAGKMIGGGLFSPMSIGSQVALNQNNDAGYILFGYNNLPVVSSDGNGSQYFVTTEDYVHTQQDPYNSYKVESLLGSGKAVEPLPKHYCLTWKGPQQLGLASCTLQLPCIGISVDDFGRNEVKHFITKGFITDDINWNWVEPANTPLFVGQTGEITTKVPQYYSLQKIGHVVSSNRVFIDLQEMILIEDSVPSPTPTSSTTPSFTPTNTPQVSTTPIATPTLTPTITMTTSGRVN